MTNFQMTWKSHTPAVTAARRKVMTPSVRLPEPMGDSGKLPPALMAVRYEAHQNLRTALQRLSEREAAA